jgi:hypothetical protein
MRKKEKAINEVICYGFGVLCEREREKTWIKKVDFL